MRTVIAVFGSSTVLNLYGTDKKKIDMKISDRIANGEAFPGEHSVRLPRRLGVNQYHWGGNGLGYITSRYHSNGKRNSSVL